LKARWAAAGTKTTPLGYGTLADLRWRLETDWATERFTLSLKADALVDAITNEFDGEFRELAIAGTPIRKPRRESRSAGTDLGYGRPAVSERPVPQRFHQLFAGREDEYLKAPSDSLRLTQYNGIANIDFAWTPFFSPDNYIRGERFSFFFPFTGTLVAPDPPFGADRPSRSLENGEFSLRLFRTVKGVEYALYAHRGFFKTPTDFRDPARVQFAPLTSLGAACVGLFGPACGTPSSATTSRATTPMAAIQLCPTTNCVF
jgi:hypothetical protein